MQLRLESRRAGSGTVGGLVLFRTKAPLAGCEAQSDRTMDVADQQVLEEIRDLRESVDLWNRGMMNIVESLGLQAKMLSQILEAVTYEPENEASPLAELLKALVACADRHTDALAAIAAGIRRLEDRGGTP